MYILGVIFLAAGAFLLVVFSPWLYLDTRGATGLLDFTELFWYAQWTGFWLVTASLLFFAFSRIPFFVGSRSAIAPSLAGLLLALFVAFSIPEHSNQREWYKGALGLRVYLTTKARLYADASGVDGLPARFNGTWKSGRDPVAVISNGSIKLVNGAASTVLSRPTCPHRFTLEYQLTPPAGLFEYFREGHATEEDFRRLSNHDYPVMICNCGMDYTVFILLEPKKLMILSKYGPPKLLRK